MKLQQGMRKIGAAALAVSMTLSLGACSNDQLADQFKAGDNKNYIAGDGTVVEIAEENRGEPIVWAGPTESGGILKSDQLAGVVVVMNFWYAACAPCRAEAKDLVEVNRLFIGKNVQFVGVNVRDTAATALAFDRNFDITWPSIIDAKSGSVLLAFTGLVPPQAVPTTLVIDKKGRVASRVLGRVEVSTLKSLVQTVVDEK